MASLYEVVSFHINIGVGDAAIHLLVEKNGSDNPKVRKACWIDGGEDNKHGKPPISETIAHIRKYYDFPDGHAQGLDDDDCNSFMRFDSVIITHWDKDHYGGIIGLIYDDLRGQYDQLRTTLDVEEAKEKMKTMTSRYFLYSTSGERQTTLYAPWWQKYHEYLGRKGLVKPFPKKINFKRASTNASDILDTVKTLTYSPANPSFVCENLCNLCYEPDEMIGVNFFSNERLSGGDFSEMTNPGILVEKMKAMKTKDRFPVAIYCVACRQYVIGSADSIYPDIYSIDEVSNEVIIFCNQ